MKITFIKENYFSPYDKRSVLKTNDELLKHIVKDGKQALIDSLLEDKQLISTIKINTFVLFGSVNISLKVDDFIKVSFVYTDETLETIVTCYIHTPPRRIHPTWTRICAKYDITENIPECPLVVRGAKSRATIAHIENAVSEKLHNSVQTKLYFNIISERQINEIIDIDSYETLSISALSHYYDFLNRLRGVNLENVVLVFYLDYNDEDSENTVAQAEHLLITPPKGVYIKKVPL